MGDQETKGLPEWAQKQAPEPIPLHQRTEELRQKSAHLPGMDWLLWTGMDVFARRGDERGLGMLLVGRLAMSRMEVFYTTLGWPDVPVNLHGWSQIRIVQKGLVRAEVRAETAAQACLEAVLLLGEWPS